LPDVSVLTRNYDTTSVLRADDRTEHPGMRIVSVEDTVHDPPVDISTTSVEWNLQLLPDCTSRSITSYQELRSHSLFLSGLFVKERSRDRIISLLSDLKLLHCSTSLNQFLVSVQITDVNPFNLSLGNDMEAAISRIRLVGTTKEDLFAIFVDCGTFNDGTFFVDLFGETPLVEGFEETGLDSVGSSGEERGFSLVLRAISMTGGFCRGCDNLPIIRKEMPWRIRLTATSRPLGPATHPCQKASRILHGLTLTSANQHINLARFVEPLGNLWRIGTVVHGRPCS
jgi:hypothetical protein